jgi:RHS repeat-associated protein
VDNSSTITDTYSLDAFGAEFASPTGSTPNPYRFVGASGYLTDPSGLQQLGARFYWPELGRFLQQDPIGDGMNWYAYAGNNPASWVDPEGLVYDGVDVGMAVWDVGTAIRCPTWKNVGFAAISVVTAALPVVPNVVGYARHGSRLGKYAIKGADEVLEMHHLLPQAKRFGNQWKRAGLKIDDYTIPLPKGTHRLKAYDGIHTGPNSWNKRWDDFFKKYPNAGREQILNHMNKLRKEFGV